MNSTRPRTFRLQRGREFITLLGGAAAWPMAARAEPGERLRRIGVLETTSPQLNAVVANGTCDIAR